MPTVPVPRVTGQTVAEAPMPGVRISGGNPDFGQSIGGAIATAGLKAVAYEAKVRAEEESYDYSLKGKNALDAAFGELTTGKADPDGNLVAPDYEAGIAELDRRAKALIEGARRAVVHPLAQRATQKDLLSYTMSLRGKMQTMAREQYQKQQEAQAWTRGESVVQNPLLTPNERAEEILKAAKAYEVATKDSVAGAKFYDKLLKDSAAVDWMTRVNAAQNEADLDTLKSELLTGGRELGPNGMVQISGQIDRRRDDIVKMQERSQKADEVAAERELLRLQSKGLLTSAIYDVYEPRLSSDARRRWVDATDKQSAKLTEGVDDPDIARPMQAEIIAASKNAGALERLRSKTMNFMLGFDPVTQRRGRPALSMSTGNKFIDQIEGYQRDIRQQNEKKNDPASKEQSLSSKRAEVEAQVRGYFKRYVETRGTDRDAAKAAQDREFAAMEGLLKDGAKDPLAWFEQWKKSNDDIIRARTALPSFVPRKADGAPDFGTARAKLAEDFRLKRGGPGGRAMSQAEYDARFRAIQKLEQEYAK